VAGVALDLIATANGSLGDPTDDVGTWCDAPGQGAEVEEVECGAFGVVVGGGSLVQLGVAPGDWADISIA
jgi:hypothetical protein